MKKWKSIALCTVSIAALAAIILVSPVSSNAAAAAKDGRIIVKGSDTMVHLVSAWAETFMKANPKFEVSVTGGGSGTGIAALLNGSTDICAASRKIKGKETKLAQEKGIQPNEIVVARDGIAVVVNPANPISEITLDDLKNIFTGAWTNWNQLGGPNEKITVLSRDSSSGTYVFFQKKVLKKEDYTQRARLMPATSSIIQALSSATWGIGYVGLGYAIEAKKTVKTLAVKDNAKAPAVVPSEATVKSGEYSIARPLHLYTNGKPTGAVASFTDFCLSAEGQEIVRNTGYVTIK